MLESLDLITGLYTIEGLNALHTIPKGVFIFCEIIVIFFVILEDNSASFLSVLLNSFYCMILSMQMLVCNSSSLTRISFKHILQMILSSLLFLRCCFCTSVFH